MKAALCRTVCKEDMRMMLLFQQPGRAQCCGSLAADLWAGRGGSPHVLLEISKQFTWAGCEEVLGERSSGRCTVPSGSAGVLSLALYLLQKP